MKHLTRIVVVALLSTLAVASTGLAQDAPGSEGVRVIEEPTVVRATAQRPAAFYVLQRSRAAERRSELRQSFVREVVRSARSLR